MMRAQIYRSGKGCKYEARRKNTSTQTVDLIQNFFVEKSGEKSLRIVDLLLWIYFRLYQALGCQEMVLDVRRPPAISLPLFLPQQVPLC